MGCCHTKLQDPKSSVFHNKLQVSIEDNSPQRIKSILRILLKSKESPEVGDLINSPIFKVKEISLNPLAYALWLGNLEAFKCLYECFQADPLEMEKNLLEHNTTALDILCQRNFSTLLVYYLPLYIQHCSLLPVSKPEVEFTMEFEKTAESPPKDPYTPVQKACEMGNISVLLAVFNFFKDKPQKPWMLDFEYHEESRGENCVLIACRNGNYAMLKFLNEVVKADFNTRNKHGENAINVIMASCRKQPSKIYLECLIYLVEIAKVDITYQYEETLLLASDKETIIYIENKLRELGVNGEKRSLEDQNLIKTAIIPRTNLDIQLDNETNFNVRDYLHEDLDRSALSSIANFNSTLDPFFSVIGGNSILRINN